MDKNIAIVTVNNNGSSVEANICVEYLTRMLVRYGENNNLEVTLWDVAGGEVDGMKSSIILFHGPNAQELLNTEQGIHRIVFRSEYDPQQRRFTVFTRVKTKANYNRNNLSDPSPPEEPIRSYILYPYKLVVNHINGNESDAVDEILYRGKLELIL